MGRIAFFSLRTLLLLAGLFVAYPVNLKAHFKWSISTIYFTHRVIVQSEHGAQLIYLFLE